MAAPTELRILDCAWDLMVERGPALVTLADVAQAAGVSRQAVYLHVGSRSGLLVEMARRADDREDLPARFRRLRALAPDAHVRGMVSAWLGHIPRLAPVAMALYGAALSGDTDARAAWDDRMADLHAAFERGVRRMHEAGQLSDGWRVATATDWIWARTHLTQWHHLVDDRGWPAGRARRHLAAAALTDIVR